MLTRRSLLRGLGAAAATVAIPGLITPARASSSVLQLLEDELSSGRACGNNAAAIEATIARIHKTTPPGPGRTIVVDIPSQHLAAYVDGRLEMESRVVVGDASWKTPDLDTKVTFVRFNPTWTVPESILKARNWRSKLANDPGYFSRLNFKVELGGAMVDPEDAAGSANSVGRFVQQPGPGNALGKVKLGLAAGGAIYLHDTNDPEAFAEDSRALSHGCIRVEQAVELAAWTLGISLYEAEEYVYGDDRKDRSNFPSPVRMMTTYFTAWPDASGNIAYYPDVYNRDRSSGSCGAEYSESGAWGATVYNDPYSNEAPQDVIVYAN